MNNPPNRPHPHDMHDIDRGSPVNMLWGLILIILTFLLVIVCVLSIDIFADATEGDDPHVTPGDSSVTDNPDNPDTPDTTPDTPTTDPGKTDTTPGTPDTTPDTPDRPDISTQPASYVIRKTADTVILDETELYSSYAVLVDVEARQIIVGKNYDVQMFPASMTKIMTLLVACEQLTEQDLAQSVIISSEIVSRMKAEGASGIGMVAGEEFTVKDLLYAIALASDGVASEQLAIHIAGSLDAFVAMMNDKAAKLGLINTNFMNCTGLHHVEHVSTCREMASIMIAAMDNELIRTLLSTQSYSTRTNVYPNGRSFNSTYHNNITEVMRPIGYQTQPAGGTVIATKTGYTPEANYCLASYYERSYDHKPYVVISADAPAAYYWVVYDYIKLYEDYAR